MASQSRESYSFVGYVVECRGSGHDAAPLRCSARANSGAYVIVRLTSSSNCRPAFARRRAVAIALRHLRRLRSRSGADFVEQLTDKTERVNLIVVLAGRETQQLGPQVSKPWCALPRRPHGSPYSLAKDTMETAARDHRAKIHITSGCSPDSC